MLDQDKALPFVYMGLGSPRYFRGGQLHATTQHETKLRVRVLVRSRMPLNLKASDTGFQGLGFSELQG